jgi:5-methyltetrahydrofolate--homocysteine methyltransferase
MAASNGMTSAIMNPLHAEDMTAILAANVLNGVDRNCRVWIRKFREPAPEPTTGTDGQPVPVSDLDARRRERETRRRRRE